MASKYLQVAYSEGKFFEYSKTQKEGFNEHKNKEGIQKGFRKYYDSIQGTLESISKEVNQYLTGNPDELRVSFKEANGDYVVITMMLLDVRKDFSTFAESLLVHLPNLEKGIVYTVTPYNFKNESDRTIAGLSFKNGETKVPRLIQSAVYKDGTKKEGDIPAITWALDRRTGKDAPDSEAKFLYLKEVLDKGLEKYVFVKNENTSAPQTPEPKQQGTPAPLAPIDDTELPF
jgi:hypothetical protein